MVYNNVQNNVQNNNETWYSYESEQYFIKF